MHFARHLSFSFDTTDEKTDHPYQAACRKVERYKRHGPSNQTDRGNIWEVLDFDKHKYRWLTKLPPEISDLIWLEQLDLDGHPLVDLSPISSLTSLRSLRCSRLQTDDLSALKHLGKIERLSLRDIKVADMGVLGNLTYLQELYVTNSALECGLTALSGLMDLYNLSLEGSAFRNLCTLGEKPHLHSLDISETQIADFEPLAFFRTLTCLTANNTKISDLACLVPLTSLQHLSLFGSVVRDVSPLAGLKTLETLAITKGTFNDLTPIIALPHLRSLCIRETDVLDLRPLLKIPSLWTSTGLLTGIDFAHCKATKEDPDLRRISLITNSQDRKTALKAYLIAQ